MLHPRLGGEHPRREDFRHRSPLIPPKGDSCPVKNIPVELLSRIFQFGTEDRAHGDVQDLTTNHACNEPFRLERGNTDDHGATDGEINTESKAEEGAGDVDLTDDIEKIGQSSSDARLPHPFPILVSHVCQHWRSAAVSTASLWTSITISPVSQPQFQHVAALLKRSKCLPIDVCVHFRSQEDDIRSRFESTPPMEDLELLFSLLVAHVHRWRSIEVRAVSSQQMYAFLRAVSYPTVTAAPQLVSLVLSASKPAARDDVFWPLIEAGSTLFSGSAPCLENISLERVIVDWNQDWMSYASRLTTLDLRNCSEDVGPSWDEFATFLRGAPALEHLVLKGGGPCGDPPNLYSDPDLGVVVATDPNPVQLLKLTHLSLLVQSRSIVYGLFRTLYMPALRSLSIDFFWNDYTEFLSYVTVPATIPAMLSIEEPPRSLLHNLETLDITLLWCGTEVIEILYDELENLKSLKISMDDSWDAPSGCTFILPLLPLTVAGNGAVDLRLPRLENLSVSDASSDLQSQVIHQVMQQRDDAGFPIKSLYVEGTYDMDEEDMMWFVDNLETFVFSRQHAKR